MGLREEQERIRNDREYFNEKYLRIRTKGLGGQPGMAHFVYNHTQQLLDQEVARVEAAGQPVRFVILKARQEGVSTYVEGYLFKKTILNRYIRSIIVAHDKDSAIGLFAMSQLFYDSLPAGMRPMKRYSNKKELLFENPDDRARPARPGLRSHMYVGTANNLELGRSATINHAHLSEFAFWPNPDATMLSLMQAIPESPSSSVFVESTANGQGDSFHRLYLGAKRGDNEFCSMFFPWYIHQEYRRAGEDIDDLSEYELWLTDKCGCDLDQIRWRRWAIGNKCGGDINLFKQEYPATDEEAFLASGSNVFDQGVVSKLIRELAPPESKKGEVIKDAQTQVYRFLELGDAGRSNLEVWKPPQKSATYIVGADVGEGVRDGNYSTIEVLCRDNLEQVAEWHGHIEPDKFADVLANIGYWYNTALVACENNGPGVATIGRIRGLYWHLYCTVNLDHVTRSQSKKIGWTTSLRTRPLIIEGIQTALREGSVVINSERLLDELTSFVYVRMGVGSVIKLRPEAQRGSFDDLIFAYGIALQAHLQYPMQNKVEREQDIKLLREEELLEMPSANMSERERKVMARLTDPEQRALLQGHIDEHLGWED